MMNRSNLLIILHIFIFLTLGAFVLWFLQNDPMTSTGDYISGIGSVASVYAILITLWQLGQVKATSEATKDAVLKKTKEIETLFTYADIERHIEMCSYVHMCLQNQQYEAAALRMENLKGIMIEIMINNILPHEASRHLQILIKRIGNDVVAVRGIWKDNQNNNLRSILQHIDDVSTYLQKVSSIIKKDAYVKKV